MNQMNLTVKECEVIIEALDKLPQSGLAGEMMGDLLGAMLMKDDDADSPAKRDFETKRAAVKNKRETEKKELEENVAIIKAKVIQIKRSLTI